MMGDNDLAADRGQVRTIFENIFNFFSNKNQQLTFLGWEKGHFLSLRPGIRSFFFRIVCTLSDQCLKLCDSFREAVKNVLAEFVR